MEASNCIILTHSTDKREIDIDKLMDEPLSISQVDDDDCDSCVI